MRIPDNDNSTAMQAAQIMVGDLPIVAELHTQIATLTRERDDARAVLRALGFDGERLAALQTMASLGKLEWGPKSHKDDDDEFFLCEYEDGPYVEKFRNNPKYYLAMAAGAGGPYCNIKLIIDPRGPRRKVSEYPNTVDGVIAAYNAARGGKDATV